MGDTAPKSRANTAGREFRDWLGSLNPFDNPGVRRASAVAEEAFGGITLGEGVDGFTNFLRGVGGHAPFAPPVAVMPPPRKMPAPALAPAQPAAAKPKQLTAAQQSAQAASEYMATLDKAMRGMNRRDAAMLLGAVPKMSQPDPVSSAALGAVHDSYQASLAEAMDVSDPAQRAAMQRAASSDYAQMLMQLTGHYDPAKNALAAQIAAAQGGE